MTTTPLDPWTPKEDGTIICVDCEANYVKEEIFGDPQWSDPRCGDCYDSHKYGR